MERVKNAGVLLFSTGIVLLVTYFVYVFVIEFAGTEMPVVIKAGLGLMLAGLFVVMVHLLFERLKDSKKEKKYFKEAG